MSGVAFVRMFLQITNDTKFNRRSASKRLRAAIDQSAVDVPAKVQFVMQIPSLNQHQQHYTGPVSILIMHNTFMYVVPYQ